jgi:hypothetical protein
LGKAVTELRAASLKDCDFLEGWVLKKVLEFLMAVTEHFFTFKFMLRISPLFEGKPGLL